LPSFPVNFSGQSFHGANINNLEIVTWTVNSVILDFVADFKEIFFPIALRIVNIAASVYLHQSGTISIFSAAAFLKLTSL